MSVEELNPTAAEKSNIEDEPPAYSPTAGSDLNLSIDKLSPGKAIEYQKTASFLTASIPELYIKCTRCETHIEDKDFRYGCSKCVEAFTCICEKCHSDTSNCRIHQVPLIKRRLKSWLGLPRWIDYISSHATKNDNPLIHALKTHNDELTTLHARDPELINAHTYLGYSPLHFAAHLGLLSGAQILLEHGALTNSRDESNQTPLMVAIEVNQPQIVNLLLQNGANIHSVGGQRSTNPLHVAAANGFPTLLSLFLEKGAIIDTPSGWGTALQLACRVNSLACASILLEKGANPNAMNQGPFGEPPITLAARNKNAEELLDLLVKYGASVDMVYKIAEDDKPWGEITALLLAVDVDNQDMVRRLVKHGADINWRSKKLGYTYLMKAAGRGLSQMCELLIESGARMDVENDTGLNAVAFAAILGNEEALDILLAKGASGKPPTVCQGKWKSMNKWCKKHRTKESTARILKVLRAAKHK